MSSRPRRSFLSAPAPAPPNTGTAHCAMSAFTTASFARRKSPTSTASSAIGSSMKPAAPRRPIRPAWAETARSSARHLGRRQNRQRDSAQRLEPRRSQQPDGLAEERHACRLGKSHRRRQQRRGACQHRRLLRHPRSTTARQPAAFFYNGSTWVIAASSQTYLGTGWHHFAAVFNDDQNVCKFYVDGVEVASRATTVTIPWYGSGNENSDRRPTATATRRWTSPARSTTCRIYNRALCPSEIQDSKTPAAPSAASRSPSGSKSNKRRRSSESPDSH